MSSKYYSRKAKLSAMLCLVNLLSPCCGLLFTGLVKNASRSSTPSTTEGVFCLAQMITRSSGLLLQKMAACTCLYSSLPFGRLIRYQIPVLYTVQVVVWAEIVGISWRRNRWNRSYHRGSAEDLFYTQRDSQNLKSLLSSRKKNTRTGP